MEKRFIAERGDLVAASASLKASRGTKGTEASHTEKRFIAECG
jgi:hypothetical protein